MLCRVGRGGAALRALGVGRIAERPGFGQALGKGLLVDAAPPALPPSRPRVAQVIEKAYKKLRLDALVIQQGRLVENTKSVNKEDLLSMVRPLRPLRPLRMLRRAPMCTRRAAGRAVLCLARASGSPLPQPTLTPRPCSPRRPPPHHHHHPPPPTHPRATGAVRRGARVCVRGCQHH